MDRIEYINPDVPRPAMPPYGGVSYGATVPATYDLAERALLAVNGLTEPLDPDYDYELYWIVDLLAEKPMMGHTVDDHVQAKFFQALPLVRTASGSAQNLHVEHSLLHTHLKMQGDDGLIYLPIKGRPWALPPAPNPWAGLDELPRGDHWCSIAQAARILGGFCIYALKDPAGPWKDAADRLARGLQKLLIHEDDIAYLFLNFTEPGRPVIKPKTKPAGLRAAIAAWVAQGLLQAGAVGNDDAVKAAQEMMTYVMRDSGYFGDNGQFTEEFPAGPWRHVIHFHAHTTQIMTALDVVKATGDKELLGRALRAYDYAVGEGNPLMGFFPEWLNYKGSTYGSGPCSSEMCEVADMIASAVKLCQLGIDKWDDVDRWVRNHFAEGQLTNVGWLTDGHLVPVDRTKEPLPGAGCDSPRAASFERVAERNVGTFSGWPSANDFVQGHGLSIMHCCTGNATRAIYYVWKHMVSFDENKLRVHLLMNRASKWADIDSHIPFTGRADVRAKQDLALEVRTPEWVKPEEVRCTVGGSPRRIGFEGRYASIGKVRKGDMAVIEFPIPERTDRIVIEKQVFRIVRRGNDVVHIDPPGVNCPLYQRAHYRNGETLWKKVTRFVPDKEIDW